MHGRRRLVEVSAMPLYMMVVYALVSGLYSQLLNKITILFNFRIAESIDITGFLLNE